MKFTVWPPFLIFVFCFLILIPLGIFDCLVALIVIPLGIFGR